ncbi:bifunctional UDP-N-acetylmuramoyl-tripeptide:D-alanyl-D-alanine ligase/alanine racemase [Bacteroidota bacterium]
MAIYTINKIKEIINGSGKVIKNSKIRNLLFDSRNLISPSDSLFFALEGKQRNGHDYISSLYNKQLRNFVVKQLPDIKKYPGANFIIVDNTTKALQELAGFHRSNFSGLTIGITGSNGKTIVKEWLFHLLSNMKKVIRSPKSYNSHIGVPLSIWLLENNYDIGIIEAGISHPGEMETLYNIIKPDIGIFTNIGNPHQEHFISLEQKIKEKLKLFKSCKTIIYCSDHKKIHEEIVKNKNLRSDNLFTWSTKESANLQITNIKTINRNTIISAKFNTEKIKIEIPFSDNASIENAIHVLALLLHQGFSKENISNKMKGIPPVAMRLELIDGINSCTVINDSYNSDIDSLSIALDYLNQQNQHEEKILILSDIYQTGYVEKDLYTKVSKLLQTKKISKLIGIGSSISHHSEFFAANSLFYRSTDEFIRKHNIETFNKQAILLKGARVYEFERISNILERKSHRTVLEINLSSIIHNLNYFRSIIPKKTGIMAVVKAFSYGTGSYEIANILQYQGVDYLAVAYVDEGIQLRKAGICVPILVMNPEAGNFTKMIDNNLEPEIYSFRMLSLFINCVIRNSVKAYPIHIKLNTGMNRLGFKQNDLDELIKKLKQHDILKVQSVFSHLVAAEDPGFDDFSKSQIKLFDILSNKIQTNFNYPVLRHILNSSGIERFPGALYDMVRIGIGLYGIGSNQNNLKNVCTLKTRISQIHNVSKGETIGYNRKELIKKDSRIAVLPIGYADGLNRKLGNRIGKVLINDKYAPIVGEICMDILMVDVTSIQVEENDTAIIFSDEYSVTEIAQQLNTISYEILSAISARVKRIYITE